MVDDQQDSIPSARQLFPLPGFDRVCFINNTLTNPNIIVGDYSYYDDPVDAKNFERQVLYHYPFIGDQLIIGKFCAIATGVTFIMNGANHKMSGFSTYPFQIFGQAWQKVMPQLDELPNKGNTKIGHDVWIGYHSVIMPGVNIGNGAIIAANSVVTGDVPAYHVYGGNPAQCIKARFDAETINQLQALAWWNWPIEQITEALPLIVAADLTVLSQFAAAQ